MLRGGLTVRERAVCKRANAVGALVAWQPDAVLIDIDHVGALNAHYGHASGDYVIRLLAEHLTQQLRFIDHVGRYAGGAFCVVLPHCSPEDAQHAIERIRLQFQSQTINERGEFEMTFSAGVAGLHDASSVEAGLDAIDQRLYRAKLAGRNRVLGNGDA